MLTGPKQPLSYTIANGFMRMVFRSLSFHKVEGAENVPSSGALLVVSNHIHALDPPLINASIPRRQVLFLAKRELVERPSRWQRWCILHYGLIPLNRARLDRRAMAKAIELLESGGTVGLFPEGTRSRTGVLQQPLAGAAYLALASEGTQVLPVAVHGIAGLKLGLRALVKRPRVTIRIGKPFALLQAESAKDRETLRQAGITMMQRIAELLPPEARGIYADDPPPS
ncbi:MAG: lysophospholipid acyltransferase family protein [Dehalococcoidia bacterium]|nr:lysophospholipid acyltransferase family protein [Dehalococcoidia bacterium]